MTGLSLALSGCGAISDASAPASITNAVKGSVNVCDLVDAQQLEGVTASQITSFAYEHHPIPASQSPNNEAVLPTLHCRIYFTDDTAFSKIEIKQCSMREWKRSPQTMRKARDSLTRKTIQDHYSLGGTLTVISLQ